LALVTIALRTSRRVAPLSSVYFRREQAPSKLYQALPFYQGMTTRTERSIARIRLPQPEPAPTAVERAWERYFARHPVVAQINAVAGRLAETIGPMCWAALIVLYFWALTLGRT
jgi:hypothetical protein